MIRRLFIVVFFMNGLLMVLSLAILPPQVATHFGQSGMPDSWSPKEYHALIFLAMELPLFLLLLFIPAVFTRIPPTLISLPHRDFWLQDENKQKAKEKLSSLMWEYGVGLFLFLFGVGILTVDAYLADPVRLDQRMFFVVFISFMLYTILWCVRLDPCIQDPKEQQRT